MEGCRRCEELWEEANGPFVQLYPEWRNRRVQNSGSLSFNLEAVVLLYVCETWKARFQSFAKCKPPATNAFTGSWDSLFNTISNAELWRKTDRTRIEWEIRKRNKKKKMESDWTHPEEVCWCHWQHCLTVKSTWWQRKKKKTTQRYLEKINWEKNCSVLANHETNHGESQPIGRTGEMLFLLYARTRSVGHISNRCNILHNQCTLWNKTIIVFLLKQNML